MRFNRKVCLFLCIVMLMQWICLPAAAEEIPDVSVLNGCNGIDSGAPVLGTAQLVENVQSAVVFETGTETLMYAWNPDQQLHPAGLVKILTALVAIENGNLSDAVVVQQAVIEQISSDARTSDLQPDEVFTLEQLLYLLLVEGSNDASLVIANHVGGSVDAFVSTMNVRAQELGCTNSVFTNVHGLHDDQQLSTARDLTRILSHAMSNEQFAEIFCTVDYDMAETNKSEARMLETGNHMMHTNLYDIYYDRRVTGGRTGLNNLGLCNLATTAQQDDMQVVCVVLGSASKVNDRSIVEKIGGFGETTQLLDLALNGFVPAQLLYEGQALKQYSVQNGIADVTVGPNVSISSVIPKDAANALSYQYKDFESAFEAPVQKGRRMSTLEIWSGSVCIAQADLYALNDVDVNYQQVEDKNGTGMPGWAVVLLILGVAVAVAVGFVYYRRRQNIKRHEKRQRATSAAGAGRRR